MELDMVCDCSCCRRWLIEDSLRVWLAPVAVDRRERVRDVWRKLNWIRLSGEEQIGLKEGFGSGRVLSRGMTMLMRKQEALSQQVLRFRMVRQDPDKSIVAA